MSRTVFGATNIETTVAPKRRLLNVLLPVERLVKASFKVRHYAGSALLPGTLWVLFADSLFIVFRTFVKSKKQSL